MKPFKYILPLCLVLHATPHVYAQTSTGSNANATSPEALAGARLRAALRRIASNGKNAAALIDAGNASLALNDAASALDFFRRAELLRPADGQVKAGIAASLVRLENPFDALRYFDEASKLGVSDITMAYDRGLAFDLLGNFERANRDYQLASNLRKSNGLTIRHAISLSLSGQVEKADDKLKPLLQQNIPQAWRARAFMLAARGDFDKAREVTRGFLDPRAASRVEGYLRQMPRLTQAQQAAAIHLGHFPAQNVGQDSNNIRTASANVENSNIGGSGRSSGSRLTPSGKPLGSGNGSKPTIIASSDNDLEPNKLEPIAFRRAPTLAEQKIANAAIFASNLTAAPQQRTVFKPVNTPRPIATAQVNDTVSKVEIDPVVIKQEPKKQVNAQQQNAGFDAIIPLPTPQSKTPEVKVAKAIEVAKPAPVKLANPIPSSPKAVERPKKVETIESILASSTIPALPKEDDVKVAKNNISVRDDSSDAATATGVKVLQAQVETNPAIKPSVIEPKAEEAKSLSLGDVVQSLEIPDTEKQKSRVAVDLENLPKPQSKPAPKKEAVAVSKKKDDPSVITRAAYWVQLSTAPQSAMKGEYRRISRKYADLFKGKQGWTTAWNAKQSRLLVGPFDGYSAAKEWFDTFKEAGGDGYVWNSPKGSEIKAIKK